eukprot:gene32226-39794_t
MYAKLNLWSGEQIDTFVRVGLIFTFNGFQGSAGDLWPSVILNTPSLMCHSCDPNSFVRCNLGEHADGVVIRPVLKGEEMTYCYQHNNVAQNTQSRQSPPTEYEKEMFEWEERA